MFLIPVTTGALSPEEGWLGRYWEQNFVVPGFKLWGCVHVWPCKLQRLRRSYAASYNKKGFGHPEDRASWYILIIKANKMHCF